MSADSRVGSFSVRTAVIVGVEAVPVTVEVSVTPSAPGFTMVGTPSATVMEARSRVRKALKACGFDMPPLHYTVNLAPGELRKTGSGLDLPIAVGILAATGQIPIEGIESCLFVGELGLRGSVEQVRGAFAYGLLAELEGRSLVVGAGASVPASLSCELLCAETLGSMRLGVQELPALRAGRSSRFKGCAAPRLDFADVIDQELAKRAMVIAAAGEHGILMVGPPGSGKSMLAKRLPTILSPLEGKDQAEAMLIHSVAGQDLDALQRGERPFRAPHHSISQGGLVGGGRPVTPGEVSLAHHGVLFLDELPEFGRRTLQSLRQPIEEHRVSVVRVDGTYLFPAQFMLVAAANPCPCGYLGDPDHVCSCSQSQIQGYQTRIGGPLMDRIDLLVDVARPSSERIVAGDTGISSAQMAEEVAAAREYTAWRKGREGTSGREQQTGIPDLRLADSVDRTLADIGHRLALGGRSIMRIARVARTIADLAREEQVLKEHIMEACAFRTRSTL